MSPFKLIGLLIILILLVIASSVMADDFQDFAELDLEKLLNTEVYSASKRTQKLSEPPNAIKVFSAEEIKRGQDPLALLPVK